MKENNANVNKLLAPLWATDITLFEVSITKQEFYIKLRGIVNSSQQEYSLAFKMVESFCFIGNMNQSNLFFEDSVNILQLDSIGYYDQENTLEVNGRVIHALYNILIELSNGLFILIFARKVIINEIYSIIFKEIP